MQHAAQHSPPRRNLARNLVIAGMIVLALGMRMLNHFVPGILPWNFTPVVAIALFGGACFGDRRWALVVPLGIMLLSDLVIGWHALVPVVYACIAATVWLGYTLRRRRSALSVALAAVGSASGFFLVTNFFVWLTSGMYPLSGTGLMACYAAGIPFYQGTLGGTLLWSGVLFGGLALLSHRYSSLSDTPVALRGCLQNARLRSNC